MGAPNTSVCSPWATTDDLCRPCEDEYAFDAALLASSLDIASDVLFELSGRRFPGLCEAVVRPCSQQMRGDFLPRVAYRWNNMWFNGCGCGPSRVCGCSGLSQVGLGQYPITGITSVKVNGVTLGSGAYRVDDYRWLVRTDGSVWPCCQDLLDDPDDTNGTAFEVAFTHGVLPPPAGVRAAADLACQLALACTDRAGECILPSRVTSLTRQGVSMVVIDPMEFLDNGKTGVYSVDLFLKTYNRSGRRLAPLVLSPDTSPTVRRVGT